MKRYKDLVIGGIQSKIFNLILLTVVLMTVAFMAVSQIQSSMLARLVNESGQKQHESIAGTTSAVMDEVVTQALGRANRMEARLADEMFDEVGARVRFLHDRAAELLAHPEDCPPQPYAGPDPADDGVWTAKVIFADGVDPADPAVTAKVGLLANLFDEMLALCPSFDAATIYIAIPEGAHLSVSRSSSSWVENGRLRSYDPRTRGWYQKAAEAGGLIFTDGERDANTGAYCIECAMPVCGTDGSLQAVIGTDLFLDEMESAMQASSMEGEYALLINQSGRAVLAPQAEAFPMNDADRGGDLRDSELTLLAQAAGEALRGNTTGVLLGELRGGVYYITASPIETTGWVLISAYSQEISGRPAAMLQRDLLQIQQESRGEYQVKTKSSRSFAIMLLIVVMLLTISGALLLGRRIVTPLNTITRRIAALGSNNMEFQMEDAYRTGDEVEQLAQSFATLSHRTVVYMDEIVKVTAEKERIGTELALANQIQAAMLPHIFPAFPNRPDFDIYACMDPAKEVGGDFYDYFLIDDDHLCMVIADVSGKGIPAALFMMASKIILQSVAMLGSTPAGILRKTNEALCSNNETEMFVTVWLGILELSTGRLTAANAGHEYPAFQFPGGRFELFKDKHGFVIGGMAEAGYSEYELQLTPGAKLFVYTDGVPEATSAENEMFGTARLIEALNAVPEASPKGILENVKQAVNLFVKDAEQFDDLTMLCFEYFGSPPGKDRAPELPADGAGSAKT